MAPEQQQQHVKTRKFAVHNGILCTNINAYKKLIKGEGRAFSGDISYGSTYIKVCIDIRKFSKSILTSREVITYIT